MVLFEKHNTRADAKTCVDEWVELVVENIFKKCKFSNKEQKTRKEIWKGGVGKERC